MAIGAREFTVSETGGAMGPIDLWALEEAIENAKRGISWKK
jgi:hypothetical protein